jgi:hypothetical protein
MLAGSGGCGIQRSEVKEEPAQRAGDTNVAQCHILLSPACLPANQLFSMGTPSHRPDRHQAPKVTPQLTG